MSEAETSLDAQRARLAAAAATDTGGGGAAPASASEASDPRDPYVGTLIGDRYRVQARIGEGGMGLVYRAEHIHMKKIVALKLLHREMGEREEAVRRFEREAQSASRLSHPSIVAVTDFGKAQSGELFLVMEYVAGESLAAALEREGRFPLRRALEIVRMVLRGLAHAHAAGVIHRDLKPPNIMLVATPGLPGAQGVKILDFGIAKMSSESVSETDGAGPTALTQIGMIFGTPSYMSPEQATGQDTDGRVDIYACGVILYEMLAGRKPFVADDLVKIMALQVTAPPPPFAKTAPDAHVPAAIETVVRRALEKDRARRYQSAQEFLNALDEAERRATALATLGAAARRARGQLGRELVAQTQRGRDWAAAVSRDPQRRRRALAVGGVVLGLIVLPILFSAVFGGRDAETARRGPLAPKPVEPALVTTLNRAETALSQGKLTEARVLLLQQLSEHPNEGRVRLMLGTLDFAEKKPAEGLASYEEALRLDPGLRGDAALVFNVRSLLDAPDRRQARAALDFLVDRVGKPAEATIAQRASEDKRVDVRRKCRDACKEIGCLARVDLVESYGLDLTQAKTCAEKRDAVAALASTKDARAIEVLKRSRRTRSGPFGLFANGNECVRKEIDEALAALGWKPPANEREGSK